MAVRDDGVFDADTSWLKCWAMVAEAATTGLQELDPRHPRYAVCVDVVVGSRSAAGLPALPGLQARDDFYDRRHEDRRADDEWDEGLRQRIAQSEAADGRCEQVWKPLSMQAREYMLLDLLGDDSLTIAELAERVNDLLRTPECHTMNVVSQTTITSMVRRMYSSRTLRRESERYRAGGKQIRHRYSRRSGLNGPIADLERALGDA